MSIPKVVVLGAGYGGLMTVKGLQKELGYNEAEVTLINQNSYHYITTLLHKPAAGTAHHEYVCLPISSIINTKKVNFIQDRVTAIKLSEKEVELENHEPLKYDYLVISLGSNPETFGIKGLMEHAFFIRNIDSVRMIREQMESAFARYQTEKREELLTIVVGGAGFTSIEYVGELVDRMPELCREYDIPIEKVRIVNVEAAPTVLPGFDPELVEHAVNYLKSKGVEFLINTPIEECTEDGVILKGGREIKAATVVWAGGVRGNQLVEESGIETIRGRVKVDQYLRAPGYEHVFVIGDSSLVFSEEGQPYPPTAQIATQQGKYLGKNIPKMLRGDQLTPFVYQHRGTIASLGSKEAIGTIGKSRKITGAIAVLIKKLNDIRWLFLVGGISMVIRKYFR